MSSALPPITDSDWRTTRVLVPVPEIGYVVAIFEGYDNQFLVRTEQAGVGMLRIWYHKSSRALLDAVLLEMRADFSVDVVGEDEGMEGLDEVYPE